MKKPNEKVYFHMVRHPLKGWIRAGRQYSDRDVAKSWTSFVKAAWRGLPTRIKPLTLRFGADGKLTPKTLERLDKEFNLDPPGQAEAGGAS